MFLLLGFFYFLINGYLSFFTKIMRQIVTRYPTCVGELERDSQVDNERPQVQISPHKQVDM